MLAFSRGAHWLSVARLLAGALAALGCTVAGVWLLARDAGLRTTLLGVFAVAANVAMYASPITAISAALRTFDASVLPVLLTVASCATSGLWFAYGLLVANLWIAAPNAAGLLLCLSQLGVVLYITLRLRADPGLTRRLKGDDEEALLEARDEADAGTAVQ